MKAFEPWVLEAGGPLEFPDPRDADAEGLVAIGGDLSPDRLLRAYASGIFPWYDANTPPLWWSPDPRCVITAESLRVSQRLERKLRQGRFELTWNRSFRRVMTECGHCRSDGSWIFPDMLQAYERLHDLGHGHSLEVWRDGELVGGIYGVQVGALFAAESKFHRETDMSKVALVALVRSLFRVGVEVFDVQFQTEHLEGLGAIEWSREDYVERIGAAVRSSLDLGRLVLRV